MDYIALRGWKLYCKLVTKYIMYFSFLHKSDQQATNKFFSFFLEDSAHCTSPEMDTKKVLILCYVEAIQCDNTHSLMLIMFVPRSFVCGCVVFMRELSNP